MSLIAILIVANLPVYYIFMKMFFGGWSGFFEAIRYWITPQVISAFRGQFWDDCWEEFKSLIYVLAMISLVSAEYVLIAPMVKW